METFETLNQFADRFKGIGNFGNERNACPLFSLFSAYNFMRNGNIGENQHLRNIESSITNLLTHDELPQYLSFDELTQFMGGDYTGKDVRATTPELLNIYGYTPIIKSEDYNKNYAIIFLKNSNFICLLVKYSDIIQHNEDSKKNSESIKKIITYAIRDCHEKIQYNFDNLDAVIIHLTEKYQFGDLTVVDGVLIEEFGNIEYLVIDKKFNILNLDPGLHDINSDDDISDIDDYGVNKDNKDHFEIDLDFDTIPGLEYSSDDFDQTDLKSDLVDEFVENKYVENKYDNKQNNPNNEKLDIDAMIAAQLQFSETEDYSNLDNYTFKYVDKPFKEISGSIFFPSGGKSGVKSGAKSGAKNGGKNWLTEKDNSNDQNKYKKYEKMQLDDSDSDSESKMECVD